VEAEALTQISLKELEEKLSLEEAEIRKRENEVVEMIVSILTNFLTA
jgi:hypothetical protein